VVRIAISPEAFGAICATLAFGSTGYENAVNENGERLIWLERSALDRLNHLRGPGESYSDAILRLAADGERASAQNPALSPNARRAAVSS
jgi:hypothetical protein